MERKKRELYDDLPPRSHPDYMKLYKKKNKDRLNELSRTYNAKQLELNPNFWKDKYDPDKAADYRIKNKHVISEKQWKCRGIVDMTYDKYISELQKQDGKCKICNKEMKLPHVDHDHNTGKYRGLLCVSCNNGLGIYEKFKNEFAEYLKETQNE
jgi:Recombination endonuclease VII